MLGSAATRAVPAAVPGSGDVGQQQSGTRDRLQEQGCPFLGPKPLEGHCSGKTCAADALQVAP